jgi:hypothetical protein
VGPSQLRTGGAAAAANALRRALGVLWLADALVKILIPFGDRAADQWYEQIMTAETGPPGLHYFLAWETNTFAAHPFLWWLPAGAELCIGVWLVTRPSSRRALAVSAAWALVVWTAGEGLGGLFGGASSVLTGYPGAALLYAIAAAVLFPARKPKENAAAAAAAGVLGLYGSRVAWLALWIGAAFFTALPQTGDGGLVFMLSTSQADAPGPLRSLDASELRWLTVGNTTILGITVAVACLAAGFTVFLGALPRLFLSLSALIALAGWVAMENLGGILTGSTADVGTGPVLILLALAFWPLAGTRSWLAREPRGAEAPSLPAPQREAQPATGGRPGRLTSATGAAGSRRPSAPAARSSPPSRPRSAAATRR